MFPKETVPIGDVVLSVREPHARRALSRRLLRSAQGRDPRLRRPRRLGTQQRRRDAVRRHAGDLGNDRDRRQGDRDQEPRRGDGRRHGLPDRGPQGERLLPAARHHGEHADGAPAPTAMRRAGFVKEREIEALCQQQKAAPAGPHARSRGAGHQSLRRQSAEGADRPLADDQAAASSFSTSRRAASTSAPRPRSTSSSPSSPARASRS